MPSFFTDMLVESITRLFIGINELRYPTISFLLQSSSTDYGDSATENDDESPMKQWEVKVSSEFFCSDVFFTSA